MPTKISDKHCWPWNRKKGWKGPLPQPRSSPPRTLGDFLVPKIKEAAIQQSHPQGLFRGQDPISQPIQISNNEVAGPLGGLLSDVGHKSRWSRHNPGLYFLCRRLAPRSFASRGQTYAQAVMAGGSVTATGAGGVDGEDHRSGRNYGGQFRAPRGGGRPPRPYGRGRGRYQQGGRGRVPRGEGSGINLFATTRERDHVSHTGISKERHNKGKEMEEVSKSMAGKHKVSQVGEPASKKKRNFVLCCEICEEEHFTQHCPLLHGPKPTAMFSGLAGEGLGFFHIPYTKAAKAPHNVSATALITIIEGSVPAELVKKELARAIPIKWDWEVCEHGNNTYIVPFPCQVELQRMISMKRLRTDNNEGVMLFEEWNNEIKPKQKLQKVWVRVYGVPYEIRSFLPLWAVGSILGATQRVDMRFMKKTGVVRLLVAVLDANCIPDDADIVVDDSLYEIFFKVDHIVPANGGEPEDFDEEDDLDPDNHNKDTDQEMEDFEKQTKNGFSFSGPSNDTADLKSGSKSNQAPNDEAPTAYEVQLAEGAIDKAVHSLLEEISASVIAEIDRSSEVYSAAPLQLDGPGFEGISIQEISKDHTVSDEVLDTVNSFQSKPLLTPGTGTPSFENIAVLPHTDGDIDSSKQLNIPVPLSFFGQSGEDADGCNGAAHNSGFARTDGQEAKLPEQRSVVFPEANVAIMEHMVCSGQQDEAIIFDDVSPVNVCIQDGLDCGVLAPVGVKKVNIFTNLNFHEFPRFALQALCKKNGIRANITNVAMANALQSLGVVIGVEDLRAAGVAAKETEVDKKTNNDSAKMVPLRRSQRSSTMSDEHTLKKVERRVAACNLELPGYFQGNVLAAVLGIAAA